MKSNVDLMLENLAPEIEQKCNELKIARKERLKSTVFAVLCITVLLVPALLVFFGVSLTLLIAPPVFMSLCIIMLLPVLLSGKVSNQGGSYYEKA